MGQNGEMEEITYWGLTVVKWPLNLTVNWRFRFSTCELIHFSLRKPKGTIIFLRALGVNIKNFSRPREYTPGFEPPWEMCLERQEWIKVEQHCWYRI